MASNQLNFIKNSKLQGSIAAESTCYLPELAKNSLIMPKPDLASNERRQAVKMAGVSPSLGGVVNREQRIEAKKPAYFGGLSVSLTPETGGGGWWRTEEDSNPRPLDS